MSGTLYACLTKDLLHNRVVAKHKEVNSDIHVVRAAFQKSVIWPANSVINIAFCQGQVLLPDSDTKIDANFSQDKADWVRQTIEKYYVPFLATIKLVWDVSVDESDVRISFIEEAGAFSVLGTQALTIPKDTITMNLGWLDRDNSNTDKATLTGTGVVVVHEFGHMLGMIHEHQRGDIPLQWNKPVVYAALGAPPNSWDKEQVDSQIFTQYDMSTLNASNFDAGSVMEYVFPDNYFINKPNLKDNRYLSNLDIVWVCKIYNNGNLPSGVNEDGTGTNPFGGDTGTGTYILGNDDKSWLEKNWYWFLIGVIILFIIFAIIRK